jgi:SpoVK/Ycf46/Vps4 family AAA+-type ATPase
MLPRLQNLRDRRWVLFAIATNSGLGDLDPAAIRPGRFDFALELPHPGMEASRRYVADRLHDWSEDERRQVKVAITGGDWSYALLDELVMALRDVRLKPDSEEVNQYLTVIARRIGPPPIVFDE